MQLFYSQKQNAVMSELSGRIIVRILDRSRIERRIRIERVLVVYWVVVRRLISGRSGRSSIRRSGTHFTAGRCSCCVIVSVVVLMADISGHGGVRRRLSR